MPMNFSITKKRITALPGDALSNVLRVLLGQYVKDVETELNDLRARVEKLEAAQKPR